MRRARNVYLRAGGGGGGGGAGEESARKRRARAPETSAKVGYSAPMPPPLWQRSEGGGGEVAVAGLEGGGSAGSKNSVVCVADREGSTGEQRRFEFFGVRVWKGGCLDGLNRNPNPAQTSRWAYCYTRRKRPDRLDY